MFYRFTILQVEVCSWPSVRRSVVRLLRRWPFVLDEPVVVAAICVAGDVVEHDEALELELELGEHSLAGRLSFESGQVRRGVFVALDENLERPNLKVVIVKQLN